MLLQAFHTSSWFRASAFGLPVSFTNSSKDLSESLQFSFTHYFISLKAILYSLLKFLILFVMNPLWVILLIWDVFKALFRRSKSRDATVLSKLVVDRLTLLESKRKPKEVCKKFLALSSISRNYYGALPSLLFISCKYANFLRLSDVNFISPFFFL